VKTILYQPIFGPLKKRKVSFFAGIKEYCGLSTGIGRAGLVVAGIILVSSLSRGPRVTEHKIDIKINKKYGNRTNNW